MEIFTGNTDVMKTRCYREGEDKIFYKVMTIDDLMDHRRFWRRFPNYRTLLGMKDAEERDAKRMAKQVMYRFFRMVLTEMIENNRAFVFPVKGFGILKVGDATKTTYRKSFRTYDLIMADGVVYDVIIHVSGEFSARMRKQWIFRPRWRTTERVWENVRKGKRYN